jgi:hypothetical protein
MTQYMCKVQTKNAQSWVADGWLGVKQILPEYSLTLQLLSGSGLKFMKNRTLDQVAKKQFNKLAVCSKHISC